MLPTESIRRLSKRKNKKKKKQSEEDHTCKNHCLRAIQLHHKVIAK